MPEDEDGDRDYIQVNRRELSQEPVSEFTLDEDGIEEVVHNEQPTVVTGADGKKCRLVVLSEDEDDADFEAEKTVHARKNVSQSIHCYMMHPLTSLAEKATQQETQDI